MADDAKKPYGDVEYADPGYQSDKKKRYPIDTEEHIRAAWSYINQADNAGKYSSGDLAKVKAKIRAAMKRIGAEVADSESKSGEGDGYGDPDEAIECRAVINVVNRVARNELVFLPVGLHAITPVSGGIGQPIKVLIDSKTAAAIEQQRAEIEARTDKRVYFDFNHEDGPASFWPKQFVWRESEGVVAKGEWSASGRKAIEGKDFRAFSPVFHVDDKRKDPARIVCCSGASPNMGGLVNDPAFSNLPLWAKNAGDNGDEQQQTERKKKMDNDEIAALRATKAELEEKVERLTALVAKNADDEPTKLQLQTVRAEVKANELELEMAEVKAKAAAAEKALQKRNQADADALVKAAVLDGRIMAKDVVTQEKWRIQIASDPATFGPMLGAIPSQNKNLRERLTFPSGPQQAISSGHGGGVIAIASEDPFNIWTKLAKVQCAAVHASREDKIKLAEEFSAIYAATFGESEKNREQRNRLLGARLTLAQDAIMAADVTDTNLGTLTGTLVTQRTLELLKFIFPDLSRFTTDFSDQPAAFNQTIVTRIINIPAVQTYSTATGWADVVASTTDVPVVINNHKGIPITFGEQLLASTMRRLFDEQAAAQSYALGKNLIDTLYGNFTDANYTNNTLSTSTAFNRAAVVDIGVALSLRGVPLGLGNRTMLLWPAAFGALEKDSSFVQFSTNVPRPELITDGVAADSALSVAIESFRIYQAPNMPSNNANLVGFAGSKSAVVIATRVPNDYTVTLPGASYGNVQMVTDPDIGITVMQVQYVNHTMGTATSRIALMFGTAPGQTAAGQLIKAAAGSGSSR